MADAAIVSLIKALVVDLNTAGRWSQQFSAERKYKPKSQLEETKNIVVQVAQSAWRTTPDNRLEWEHQFDIDIGIMLRADPKQGDQADAAFDKVLKIAEEIVDYYSRQTIRVDDCKLIAAGFGKTGDAPYFPDHIESLNQITTVITLTFWKIRDPSA